MRTLYENEKAYIFNNKFFNNLCKKYVRDMKTRNDSEVRYTLALLFDNLADNLHLSPDSIVAYYKGKNGPGDLTAVKELAEFFNVDYQLLLNEREEIEMKTENITPDDIIGKENRIEQNTITYVKNCKSQLGTNYALNISEKEAIMDIYYSFAEIMIECATHCFDYLDPDCSVIEIEEDELDDYWKKLMMYRLVISPERYSKIDSFFAEYDKDICCVDVNYYEVSEKICDYYNSVHGTKFTSEELYHSKQFDYYTWSVSYDKVVRDYYMSKFYQIVQDLF